MTVSNVPVPYSHLRYLNAREEEEEEEEVVEEFIQSCTREMRSLTRWDQHALSDNTGFNQSADGGGGGGGVYSESYTVGARFLTGWDKHAVAQRRP